MKIGPIDLDQEVLVIAEIGNNHEGNFELAQEMIRLAAQAGAGAVKFQTIVPDRLVAAGETDRIRQLGRFRFSYEQFAALKETADAAGIMFLSTPFDLESAEKLDPLVPAYKIASGDNNFFPLLDVVARTGKPVIMSTGLMELAEVENSIRFLRSRWNEAGQSGDAEPGIALLHCVVNYPTAPEDGNLLAIRTLAALGTTVGYSDHTIGIEAAVLSVALGARVIEKHFTIDKNHSSFRDHQLSADPADLSELVRRVRLASTLLGTGAKEHVPNEAEIGPRVRRSIVAARDLPAGHTLAWADLSWVRPGGGLAPGQEDQVLGKRLATALAQGEQITLDGISG